MSDEHKPSVKAGPAPVHGLLAEYDTPLADPACGEGDS